MSFFPWLRNRTSTRTLRRGGFQIRPTVRRFRPRLEVLEGRWLPSTLTVTNNLDNGPGSLRAEITAANSGDTIVFAPALKGDRAAPFGDFEDRADRRAVQIAAAVHDQAAIREVTVGAVDSLVRAARGADAVYAMSTPYEQGAEKETAQGITITRLIRRPHGIRRRH
jgi:hypothetical protein